MGIRIVMLCLLLSGCATMQDKNTFAACKAVDVATTVVGVSTGAFPEANPLMAKLLSHGYAPFILLSIAMWYAIDRIDNHALTMGANAITCPIAARNVLLLVR